MPSLLACGQDGAGPVRPVPASIVAVAMPSATAQAGTLAGTLTVKVTDENGVAISGSVVTFTVSLGGGRVSPATDTTGADGTASGGFTIGTVPGVNEVTAVVSGVTPLRFAVTGVVGPTRTVAPASRVLLFRVGLDSAAVAATPRDTFGNATGDPVTWTPRDPTLVSATPAQPNRVAIRVLRRPGQTYVVAASGVASDSVLVSVHDASSTPCTFVATPTTLPLGGSVAVDGGAACVRVAEAGAEYVVVAHYNTTVTGVSARLQVTGSGIAAPASAFPTTVESTSVMTGPDRSVQRDFAFELALRQRERREIGSRVASAREWFKASRSAALNADAPGASRPALRATAKEGDVLTVNVNASDFCSHPELRAARVVAITDGAVVMADTSNPADGFSDAEYRSFGVAMDTLVTPVDTAAFGAPADVDGNQKVGILFTSAVNALTPPSAGSIVLGFYYIRDLLPRESPFGNCPGSNVGELFYVLVPDPNATVNSNRRTKGFVDSVVVGVIGHEYQHLINASRRMYITNAPQVDEEVWLNEGLSHIAEELLFYRASGQPPRQNIGGAQLGNGSPTRAVFDMYQRGNFGRYREYLRLPESTSPLARSDNLATRGATWSFLRYLVDRARVSDGDFWHRLVNSKRIGVPNLDDALSGSGLTTLSGLRAWAVSVLTDDLVNPDSATHQQLSWNFLSALPAVGLGTPYPLVPRTLADAVPTGGTLQGGASAYLRFAVPQNQEALIQATGFGGGQIPGGIRLTVVRIK